jgi:cytochrome P450
MSAETPVDVQRKVRRGEPAAGCPVHAGADGSWRVQDYATAKEFLRSTETRQAGFAADSARKMNNGMRMPVLYRDGTEHREHRRRTAKYFTPRRVDEAYRGLMHRLADEQCAILRRRGEVDLADLSFTLAVAVTGEIIGLTESRGNMARRLNRFFVNPGGTAMRDRLRSAYTVNAFYWLDVRPAVAARRRQRRDDLISHLLDEGCRNAEVLGECITFAAAGMVTTREFIVAAAWHLFTDDELRAAYTGGDEPQRLAILHELLRLEPVVGNLYRRTDREMEIGGATVPAGSLVDVSLAAVNLDPAAVGPDAGAVCPGRPLAAGVSDSVLSFGDGPHRCPGAYIAIQETDIFLTKLFAMPGLRLVREPVVRLRPEIASYELTGMRVAADG